MSSGSGCMQTARLAGPLPVCRTGRACFDGLEFDQDRDKQIVFVYPRRVLAGNGTTEYLEVLAPLGYSVRAVNDAEFSAANLESARLVIFPHGAAGFRDSSFARMQEFVNGGGCVWPTMTRCCVTRWGV